MLKSAQTMLAIGLASVSIGIAKGDDSVPGGWDAKFSHQSFVESGDFVRSGSADPTFQPYGEFGPLFGFGNVMAQPTVFPSRPGEYNALVPFAKTIKRSTGVRRRRAPR